MPDKNQQPTEQRQDDPMLARIDPNAWDDDSEFYDEYQERAELSTLRDRIHRIGHINLDTLE